MRILFLAPLPPPVTGHSLVSAELKRGLEARHALTVVDLGRDSSHDGRVTWRRLAATVGLLREVRRARRRFDAAYLTISESLAGNLKDLAIYLLVGRLDRMVIHLHGGSIGRLLFDRRPWVRALNRRFISRLRGVILSGASHRGIFAGMIDPARIHEIPNFAPDWMFVDGASVQRKFSEGGPLRVLYLSGMSTAKGYGDLLDAWLALEPAERARIELDFAGRFDDDASREAFVARIAELPGVTYHGLVDDVAKRALFERAHVFCLPSRHLEGQPISILEAYAAGCVVSCTVPPGVLDIFEPGTNGWALEVGDPQSVASVFRDILARRGALAAIARRNRDTAESRYRLSTFIESVNAVLAHG